MGRRLAVVVAGLAVVALPSGLQAQISVAPRLGTLGLGADVGLGVAPVLTLRAGVGFWPIDLEINDLDGVDYEVFVPSTLTLGVDLHPGGGGFHLSGGVLIQFDDLALEGTPSESVEIGDQTYSPEEVGTLRAELENKSVAPFLAIGFGKHGTSGIGLFIDLGLAFMGSPGVSLTGSGGLAGDPEFEDDLAEEAARIEDDDDLKVWGQFYPIVNFGLRIGVGD